MNRMLRVAAVAAAALAAAAPAWAATGKAAPARARAQAACSRDCLVDLMNRWLEALPTHSAEGLPIAANIRFTEQAASIPVGDGLWISATEAPKDYEIIAADPVSGQVGAIVVMKQWDKPILLAARLKVAGGRITEAEHVFADRLRDNIMGNLKTPRAALLADVPPAERTPRAALWAAANSYFDSLEQDSGEIAPFADDCVRIENGMQTVNNKTPAPSPIEGPPSPNSAAFAKIGAMTCREQLNTRVMQYITMIRPRHILILDEQKGLAFGFPRFVHRGKVRVEKIVGVEGVDTFPMPYGPFDLQAAEMFKVRSGRIHEVEAVGFTNAYMSPTGWEDRYPETYKYTVTHPLTQPYPAGPAPR